MTAESKSEIYERGLKLAEAGQHDQALECIRQHLVNEPGDVQAWNDIGAILFCMGDGSQAIEHFEKAKSLSGSEVSAEIYWNLTEAYLAEELPGEAARLFGDMEKLEILNIDTLNRTANLFLWAESLGNAMEMLLRSLEMAPNQEILSPMAEVIRSKRANVALFCRRETGGMSELFKFADKRFNTEVHIDKTPSHIRQVMDWSDISWFDGCDDAMVESLAIAGNCKVVVRLDSNDISGGPIDRVNWDNVDALVITTNPFAEEALIERVGDIAERTRIVTVGPGADTRGLGFVEKKCGKKIACIGDIDSHSNPMFLVQCMQKLHYLDSDYRLYFAGDFTDKATEQYVRHTVERLDLSSVVFFDGRQNNMNAWLRDKHYVVSGGINEQGLEGVLAGMACGLRPAVHNFPGAEVLMDKEFLFDLAEDFCELLLVSSYEPERYRSIVEENHTLRSRMSAINDVLVRLEKDVLARNRAQNVEPTTVMEPLSDDSLINSTAVPIMPMSPDVTEVSPGTLAGNDSVADDIAKMRFVAAPWTMPETTDQQPAEPASNQDDGQKSLDDIAAEALEASQILNELANQNNGQTWSPEADNAPKGPDMSQLGYGSLDASVRGRKIAEVASEFADSRNATTDEIRRMEAPPVPFVG